MFYANVDAYAFGSYAPVLVQIVLAVAMAGTLVALSRYVGRRIAYPEKYIAYESGMNPRGDARERFSVKFYLVAILFILFDIEVVFLYPWAVEFKALGGLGLVEMGLFLLILLVGYLYLLGTGALTWARGGLLERDDDDG